MKVCVRCGEKKPLEMFYKHSKMKDGYLNKCIECTKKTVIKNRNKKIEYYREYDRERGSLPARVLKRKKYQERMKSEGKWTEMRKKYTDNYREKYPKKHSAKTKVSNTKRTGKIKNEVCFVCGNTETEAHHTDYSKPLLIIWLCDKCHKEEHKRVREEERSKT